VPVLEALTGIRFLVTGGAGFIGSNLCDFLLSSGAKVKCLDNLSTGKFSNVVHHLHNPLFNYIEGDIRDFDLCLKVCENVDFVLHQAAWGSVPRSVEMPLLYEDINVRGTLNMLEASRLCDVRKFVYASSSSVYGDDPNIPKMEGREGRPLSPYAQTKRACEEYGRLYWHLYGLPTVGLRYFNVFGNRQDPEGAYAAVVPRIAKQLLSGERASLYGDGMQTRDFTYVDNVVQANVKAAFADTSVNGDVFNIAYGGRRRLIDVYYTISEALGVTLEPEFVEARKGDIRHSSADISKAAKMLGYAPEWSFDEGIKNTIEWYKKYNPLRHV
jgi:UDP-N-acetylglucosamine 4-epimerase